MKLKAHKYHYKWGITNNKITHPFMLTLIIIVIIIINACIYIYTHTIIIHHKLNWMYFEKEIKGEKLIYTK